MRRLVAPIVEHAIEHEAGHVGGESGTLPVVQNSAAQIFQHGAIERRRIDDLDHRIVPSRGEEMGDGGAILVAQIGEIRAAGSEEVFEVIQVLGRISASSCAKILCFSARSSVAASIAQSASRATS